MIFDRIGAFLKENHWNIIYNIRNGKADFKNLTSCLSETTVGENIIATIKMRKKFCYPLKMVIFLILQ